MNYSGLSYPNKILDSEYMLQDRKRDLREENIFCGIL